MGVNHGNGVPGKNTAGSLGDIYINDTTGEYYKCNLAIKISGSEGFEYEWKKMKSPFSCPAGEEGTDGTPYIKQDSHTGKVYVPREYRIAINALHHLHLKR